MKSLSSARGIASKVSGLVLASAVPSQACTVCMGADFKSGEAINGAIFLMLGFLAAMFMGIGAVTFGIYRRRHQLIPQHATFASPSPVAGR